MSMDLNKIYERIIGKLIVPKYDFITGIEALKVETSLDEKMIMCSCGEGFFGYNRVNELHKHLRYYPNHNDVMYKSKKITGTDWFKTFTAKKQQLEEWLYAEGTPEQQVAFENVSNGKNTLCIGKAGTGKTFLVKKEKN